ncbi:adenylate/guanylate cyclase domain-containing protein [Conexibacter sp. CPCC 206217]|uniref:adenylate/guanylate cyclase domain-containing protein n=1 Tax=Conexibacter sp. CPCC 206217 TaxID=3064574 RepID=UPI00271B1C40|nr:adenylate/guanylate cyclase domain-containing protein [Conexibacter sp. CPCC 206217]MDO8210913.1 adenylate/guanylate cyclase domain-containing protein [Conexibacter sp. CPCC 206217]
MLSRPVRVLIVGLLACALTGAVYATGVLDGLERISVDARFDVRGSQGAPGDVVVVGIGDSTFAKLRRQWPFPRRLHAQAIDALLDAGARAVAYDVQFSEPSDPAEDRALLVAAADPRVVLGTSELTRTGQPAVLPALLRRRAAARVGYALFPVDPDGVMRQLDPRVDGVPHLAVLASGAGAKSASSHPIDFAGPAGTVPEIPFEDVLNDSFDRNEVRDKIVVVGATAENLQDYHAVAAGHLMSGPEINANAIQTILDGYPLNDASTAAAVLLVMIFALLAPLATLVRGPPSRALLLALAAGAAGVVLLYGVAQLSFDNGTIVPVAPPLLALLLGTAGAVALTYTVEVRARQRMRVELERFVAPAVASELLTRDQPLESHRVEATVLFCDLRGFTTLAERLDAEQVIRLLNRYLELVSEAVLDAGGTVLSYQGDGVMAVFGAPLPQPDHAARALAAARAILDDALPRFNRWAAERGLLGGDAATPAGDSAGRDPLAGAAAPHPDLATERSPFDPEPALSAGIGVNTGPVMAGVIGSERRVEYAAIGDATNVAARLQALGRDFDPPARLFVAAATAEALGDRLAAERLELHGEVFLKGRREPVTVWFGR